MSRTLASATPGDGIVPKAGSDGKIAQGFLPDSSRALFSGLMSAVPTQTLTGLSTWVNQRNMTAVDADAGLTLVCETIDTTNNVTLLVKTAPTPPYTITTLLAITALAANYPFAGIGWRNSSDGKFHSISLSITSSPSCNIPVQGWSDTTTKETTHATTQIVNTRVWLRIKDDGTTVYFYFSTDGWNFYPHYSVAKSSGYLGTNGYNQVAFLAAAYNSKIYATLESYTES